MTTKGPGMGAEGTRTDRPSVMPEQFDEAADMARTRLAGLEPPRRRSSGGAPGPSCGT